MNVSGFKICNKLIAYRGGLDTEFTIKYNTLRNTI